MLSPSVSEDDCSRMVLPTPPLTPSSSLSSSPAPVTLATTTGHHHHAPPLPRQRKRFDFAHLAESALDADVSSSSNDSAAAIAAFYRPGYPIYAPTPVLPTSAFAAYR